MWKDGLAPSRHFARRVTSAAFLCVFMQSCRTDSTAALVWLFHVSMPRMSKNVSCPESKQDLRMAIWVWDDHRAGVGGRVPAKQGAGGESTMNRQTPHHSEQSRNVSGCTMSQGRRRQSESISRPAGRHHINSNCNGLRWQSLLRRLRRLPRACC